MTIKFIKCIKNEIKLFKFQNVEDSFATYKNKVSCA